MKARGFTLVEVVVVIAILGIAAGAAVPALLRSDAGDPVDVSAREVVSLLRSARRAAVERSLPATVTIEPAGGRYWVEVGVPFAAESVSAGVIPLPSGVRLVGLENRARFVFDPTGAGHGAQLSVQGDGQVAITVDRWTGEVRAESR